MPLDPHNYSASFFAVVRKVKVKCNQTGKVLVVKVAELTDENDEPVCFEELEEGFSVFWTVNELSYPVTVLRLLGNSKPV